MKRTIYKYYLIYFLTLTIVMVLISLLLIYPAVNRITSIKRQISQEKIDLQQKLNHGFSAKNIRSDLAKIQSSLSTLDRMFIQPGQELNLLSILETLATKHHVALIINPDFTGQNDNSGITKIPLELKATGSFNDLMSFANDLDAIDYYYIIDNLSLIKIDADQASLVLTGQVYLKPAQPQTP